MVCQTLNFGLVVLALATVPCQKQGLAPKRLVVGTLILELDGPLVGQKFGSNWFVAISKPRRYSDRRGFFSFVRRGLSSMRVQCRHVWVVVAVGCLVGKVSVSMNCIFKWHLGQEGR